MLLHTQHQVNATCVVIDEADDSADIGNMVVKTDVRRDSKRTCVWTLVDNGKVELHSRSGLRSQSEILALMPHPGVSITDYCNYPSLLQFYSLWPLFTCSLHHTSQ